MENMTSQPEKRHVFKISTNPKEKTPKCLTCKKFEDSLPICEYANTKVLFALLILLFVVLLVGLVIPNYRLNTHSFMLKNENTSFVRIVLYVSNNTFII